MMRTRRQHRTDQEAIDHLAALGREKGHLTTAIIAAADDILSAESFRMRFGSLVAAYELAGHQPEPRQRLLETADKYRTLLARLAGEIVEKSTSWVAMIGPDRPSLSERRLPHHVWFRCLEINGSLSVPVHLLLARPYDVKVIRVEPCLHWSAVRIGRPLRAGRSRSPTSVHRVPRRSNGRLTGQGPSHSASSYGRP